MAQWQPTKIRRAALSGQPRYERCVIIAVAQGAIEEFHAFLKPI